MTPAILTPKVGKMFTLAPPEEEGGEALEGIELFLREEGEGVEGEKEEGGLGHLLSHVCHLGCKVSHTGGHGGLKGGELGRNLALQI